MSQKWEYGSAARQPGYDDTNPSSTNANPQQALQPGQLYGQQGYAEMPSFLPPTQLPEWQPMDPWPVQGEAGAPYSAELFEHQPTAVMPSGWEETPFAAHAEDFSWQPISVEMPVWQDDPEDETAEPGPVYYAAADVPMRDPFTPAQPREDKPHKAQPKTAPQQKQRRPVRLDRLLALIAAGIMLCICVAVSVRMVIDLARNEREMEAFRADYLESNGVEVYHAGAKVDLLPEGQTYAPTSTPAPTLYAPTPSPTPIIPIDMAAVFGASTQNAVLAQQPENTPAPVLRSRLNAYPKNPMCNITESIRTLVEDNADVVGRLVIPGLVDEMVMQRNNTYYVNHSATGATSDSGAVFADESCSLRMPPENLLLRGQSGVPGKIFAPLWQFVSGGTEFVGANMIARLTTLYEEENYVLFAVLVTDLNPSGSRYFNYASNPTFTTDEAMMQYVESVRQRSLYKFNVDVAPSDRLLTLATLGSGENNLVLFYRMVRETENMGI